MLSFTAKKLPPCWLCNCVTSSEKDTAIKRNMDHRYSHRATETLITAAGTAPQHSFVQHQLVHMLIIITQLRATPIINSYCPFWAQYQEISRVHCRYCLQVRSKSKQCHRQWTSDVSMVLRSKRIIRNLLYRPAILFTWWTRLIWISHVTNTTDTGKYQARLSSRMPICLY